MHDITRATGTAPSRSDLKHRDTENVLLGEGIRLYFEREVLPHVPDTYIYEQLRDQRGGEIGEVGYEIDFSLYFYD